MPKLSIAALIACHNRKRLTLRCLDRLFACARPEGLDLRVFVTDDGSTDGTPAAIESAWPDVTVLSGTGNLWWAGGMVSSWTAAARKDPDYFLWLNDDVELLPDFFTSAFADIAQLEHAHGPVIWVGATVEKGTGRLLYSGRNPVRRLPDAPVNPFDNISPAGTPVQCRAMCGNVVIVPRAIHASIGTLDAVRFPHNHGDHVYAITAQRAGYKVFTGSCAAGTNEVNPLPQRMPWHREELSAFSTWNECLGNRFWPPGPTYHYLVAKHGVCLAPVLWLKQYFKILLLIGRAKLYTMAGQSVPPSRNPA